MEIRRTQFDLLVLMVHLERPDGAVAFEDLRTHLGISSRSMLNRLVRLSSYNLVQPSPSNDDSRWRLTEEGERVLRASALRL
jgi:DNA-binding MarR family transcriptional regulator